MPFCRDRNVPKNSFTNQSLDFAGRHAGVHHGRERRCLAAPERLEPGCDLPTLWQPAVLLPDRRSAAAGCYTGISRVVGETMRTGRPRRDIASGSSHKDSRSGGIFESSASGWRSSTKSVVSRRTDSSFSRNACAKATGSAVDSR